MEKSRKADSQITMKKISIFKTNKAAKPMGATTALRFVEDVRDGEWKEIVEDYRMGHDKKLKDRLPGVTLSAYITLREKGTDISKRMSHHSGFIGLDVDGKDNPDMRVDDLVDREAFAQYITCGGGGVRIVYRCVETKSAAEHRRIYDALVERLAKKGIKLKVDPIVKSIGSLSYVSYDPQAYINAKTKFVAKPLPPIKVHKKPKSDDVEADVEQLNDYIKALGKKDVTTNYEDWLNIMFGLSYSLGEAGRKSMHLLSKNYKGYSKAECDEKYDGCLEASGSHPNPVTIATVFSIIRSNLAKGKLKELEKKYKRNHAIGVGEDEEQADLVGMVRYKLFLFAKKYDKHNILHDLIPAKINLNAFEKLLRDKGFYRHGKEFVQVVENIVTLVDAGDILRIVTNHVEGEGNYTFTYQKMEFEFSWEELAHLWRESRAKTNITNQIHAALTRWEPNLLKDTATDSFIPYRNGVVRVNAKEVKLIPYKSIDQQIWKERILSRDFKKNTSQVGMFEKFFINVNGGDKKSLRYKKALWYYGYILQGTKRLSTARAWLLYDSRTGKNGRTGKTIIGSAVGKIRSVVMLDGKSIDFRNRFQFQTIKPWTNVVFIDDPYRHMSLDPIFNMITGTMYADRKNTDPIVKDDIKVMIASNWILENEGESEKGRQFVTQLTDFYVDYGKKNGNTITPIVDFHGKEFFTDWDDKDWREFDNFSMEAIQFHLKTPAPESIVIRHAPVMRFIQMHDDDLFIGLKIAVQQSAVQQNGHVLIPRSILIGAVKDMDGDTSENKAGKIARSFLYAISGMMPEVTSITRGSIVTMMYKLKCKIDELELKN